MPGTPYEWRRWAAESRLMEVESEEILRTLRRHGFDADAEVPELQSHPYLEAAGWIRNGSASSRQSLTSSTTWRP